ncbi:MAG: hypothetical protein D6B27_09195 [Gammaproteobacteria bacterium]|nr:MAG: hypothetical protein D6B27_09195 [Gammaproteobacteria bacterium]
MDKRILIHICCAPCATASVERVIEDGIQPVLYFSNSNISPHEEFMRRLESARTFTAITNLQLEVDKYNHENWLAFIKGLEGEPEKGGRCNRCFEFSLQRTYLKAQELGIEKFCTTLTISPHKISSNIFKVGEKFPGFQAYNFKKKDGFRRSLKLSDEYELYRQKYCGCEFSFRE